MKVRNSIKKLICTAAILTLGIALANTKSFADSKDKKDLMYYGLQKINAETYNLRDT